jgi:nitrogen PTS system EIIA component
MNEKIDPHFYHFLAPGNIVCNMTSIDSAEMIEQLSDVLCRNTAGLDKTTVVNAVMAREKLVPTVIAPGLAVPHARLEEVDKLLVVLGTSQQGVDFKSDEPVNVAIMILTPKDDPGLHLQVLAALAKDFQDPQAVKEISNLNSTSAIMHYFDKAKVEILDYLHAKDIMDQIPISMLESDTLSSVIEMFAHNDVKNVPVLDNEGDLRGTVSRMDVLKFSLPEHILWMDDLTPIYRFQPFAEMLRDDEETKLADFMNEDTVTVDENIPAIQVAKMFIVDNLSEIMVTREGRLVGVVRLNSFITKLFWE